MTISKLKLKVDALNLPFSPSDYTRYKLGNWTWSVFEILSWWPYYEHKAFRMTAATLISPWFNSLCVYWQHCTPVRLLYDVLFFNCSVMLLSNIALLNNSLIVLCVYTFFHNSKKSSLEQKACFILLNSMVWGIMLIEGIKSFDLSSDTLILHYHYYKSMVGQIEILKMPLPASYGIVRIKSGIRREITPMIHCYYGDVLDYYKEFSWNYSLFYKLCFLASCFEVSSK